MLARSWERAWRGIGASGDGHALRDALLQAYGEAHRHYHTLQHLGECLALFDATQAHAEHPAEVEWALWFHDAVYDPRSHDNEIRSADWARQALLDACVAPDVANRVHALILLTRHEAPAQTRDGRLLMDIDLSILGAPAVRFAEYERQIRAEYAHLTDDAFLKGRRAVMQGFARRAQLFSSPAISAALTTQAASNLAATLAIAANPSSPWPRSP